MRSDISKISLLCCCYLVRPGSALPSTQMEWPGQPWKKNSSLKNKYITQSLEQGSRPESFLNTSKPVSMFCRHPVDWRCNKITIIKEHRREEPNFSQSHLPTVEHLNKWVEVKVGGDYFSISQILITREVSTNFYFLVCFLFLVFSSILKHF